MFITKITRKFVLAISEWFITRCKIAISVIKLVINPWLNTQLKVV